MTLLELSRIALATDDAARAERDARRALAILIAAEVSRAEIAEAELLVAQVQWATGERRAALEQARSAIAVMRDAGPSKQETVREGEVWLRARTTVDGPTRVGIGNAAKPRSGSMH